MSDVGCAETQLSDHVARLWRLLETETVRIGLDLKRTVGVDAPDGPIIYWDGATFSDDVAKALVAERAKTEEVTYAAYLGICVLRTMCRKADLRLAEQRCVELIAEIGQAFPHFAARTALR